MTIDAVTPDGTAIELKTAGDVVSGEVHNLPTPTVEEAKSALDTVVPTMMEAEAGMMKRETAIQIIMQETGCSREEAEATLGQVQQSKAAPPAPLEAFYESKAKVETRVTLRNTTQNVGRNEPCGCGSGKKFKKCCLGKSERLISEIKKEKIIVTDPEVAKALRKHQAAGKTVKMVRG